jgi:hypothetical protein
LIDGLAYNWLTRNDFLLLHEALKSEDRDDMEKNKQGTGPRELSGVINKNLGKRVSGSISSISMTT